MIIVGGYSAIYLFGFIDCVWLPYALSLSLRKIFDQLSSCRTIANSLWKMKVTGYWAYRPTVYLVGTGSRVIAQFCVKSIFCAQYRPLFIKRPTKVSVACWVDLCGAVSFMKTSFNTFSQYLKYLVLMMSPGKCWRCATSSVQLSVFSNLTEELDERQPLYVCLTQFTATT